MSFSYRNYVLNSYKEEPWYNTEITLFQLILSKLPKADETYVNAEHHHNRLATPDGDASYIKVAEDGTITLPYGVNGVAILDGIDHHLTTTTDLSAYGIGITGMIGTVGEQQIAYGADGSGVNLTSSSDFVNYTNTVDGNRVLEFDGIFAANNEGNDVANGGLSLLSGTTGCFGFDDITHQIALGSNWHSSPINTKFSNNTYAEMGAFSHYWGGLLIAGYGSYVQGLVLCGTAAEGDDTTGDVKKAPVEITANKYTPAGGLTGMLSNEHMAIINSGEVCKVAVFGNGDISTDGTVYVNSTNGSWDGLRVAAGGGVTGTAGSAAGYVTLVINGTTHKLLYQV